MKCFLVTRIIPLVYTKIESQGGGKLELRFFAVSGPINRKIDELTLLPLQHYRASCVDCAAFSPGNCLAETLIPTTEKQALPPFQASGGGYAG